MRTWAVVLLLVSGLPALAQPSPQVWFSEYRIQEHLSVPVWSPELAGSAHRRALVLAESGSLAHQDAQGRGPGLQMASEGLPPGEYGEVLGAGADLGAVWRAWLASPTHRAVLSTPGWTLWGFGSAVRGPTRVWVLRLWRP
jgi:uncharacterized protein YkwD